MVQISAASFQSGYANYFSAPITIATFSFSNHQILADLTSLTIQLRIFDGDTSPGDFDYNDLYLALDGISTGIPLSGFSNNLDVTLSIGGTPGNAAAILSSLHSDGLLVATIIDNDYSDNYISLPSGFNASLVLGGAAAPTLALAADTGSSNSDGITNNGTVNVTGLETGATWQYSTNGGSSWTNGTGTSFVLSSGTYSPGNILVRQSDLAGNTSANGQLGAVTIDTTKPLTTAAITAVTDNVGFFQGAVDEFSGTDDATPIFGGTISAALSADETLAIYNRDSFLGNATVNNATKTWSFAPATLPNTTGVNYAITARVTDVAGNYSQSPIRYFWLDTTASTTTTAITSVADNVGNIQGTLVSGAVTDDITPTISGVLSAPLGTGETLRLYNGNKYLGLAIPADGVKTWASTSYLADGFYSINARVVDAVGNIGAASATQNFSIDSTSNQLIGNASANTLTATGAKDLITGLGGADTFRLASLTQSTLANFDRITDFTIGTDIFDGPTAVSAANINKLGSVAALDAQSISTVLTSSYFAANKAATFSYADPSGTLRSFLALNNGVAGFSASTDAIVEITGYIGSLNNLQIF
jgi:hypothetical protein